jgi:hypothetical protein
LRQFLALGLSESFLISIVEIKILRSGEYSEKIVG